MPTFFNDDYLDDAKIKDGEDAMPAVFNRPLFAAYNATLEMDDALRRTAQGIRVYTTDNTLLLSHTTGDCVNVITDTAPTVIGGIGNLVVANQPFYGAIKLNSSASVKYSNVTTGTEDEVTVLAWATFTNEAVIRPTGLTGPLFMKNNAGSLVFGATHEATTVETFTFNAVVGTMATGTSTSAKIAFPTYNVNKPMLIALRWKRSSSLFDIVVVDSAGLLKVASLTVSPTFAAEALTLDVGNGGAWAGTFKGLVSEVMAEKTWLSNGQLRMIALSAKPFQYHLGDNVTHAIDAVNAVEAVHAINADIATVLKTKRQIELAGDVVGSALFDGSGNISINATVIDDSHTHSAATVPQNISGNSGTTNRLGTARTIALSGDVIGSTLFDGSTNVTVETTVIDDSHYHSQTTLPIATMYSRGVVSVGDGISVNAYGQISLTPLPTGSQTFTTPGTHSFTVPDRISILRVSLSGGGGGGGGGATGGGGGYGGSGGGYSRVGTNIVGSGGGGGGGSDNYQSWHGSGGGAGGCVRDAYMSVTPGATIEVVVGAGGAGGAIKGGGAGERGGAGASYGGYAGGAGGNGGWYNEGSGGGGGSPSGVGGASGSSGGAGGVNPGDLGGNGGYGGAPNANGIAGNPGKITINW